MPTAAEVAKYFLSLCDEEDGEAISNLKLQKLLLASARNGSVLSAEPRISEFMGRCRCFK